MIKIDLPKVKQKSNAKSHPYPFQIAMQTLEFTQATLLYITMVDYMAGKYIAGDNNFDKIRVDLDYVGLSKKNFDSSFDNIIKYKEIFKRYMFQDVLIQLKSHWDWFINNMSSFVLFARGYIQIDSIVNNKDLKGISFKNIEDQIKILEGACELSFNIDQETISHLKEMSWVRNLGIHNRWEVDEKYKKQTSNNSWVVGEIRIFNRDDLTSWYKCLTSAINKISIDIAIKFKDVPTFNHR